MVEMSLSKASCAIQWIDPDYHLILVKLVRKLVIVVISFRCCDTVNLLELLEVVAMRMLLLLVVVKQHLTTDCVFVELVWLDVRTAISHLSRVFILFANDLSSWVQLFEVVNNSVLYMYVSFRENVHAALALDHLGEGTNLPDVLQYFVDSLKNLDSCLQAIDLPY